MTKIIMVEEYFGFGESKTSKREARWRKELFAMQHGLCFWCFEKMSLNHLHVTPHGRIKFNPRFATFEHLKPKVMGGHFTKLNLALAHAACNHQRIKRKWPHDPFYGMCSVSFMRIDCSKVTRALDVFPELSRRINQKHRSRNSFLGKVNGEGSNGFSCSPGEGDKVGGLVLPVKDEENRNTETG